VVAFVDYGSVLKQWRDGIVEWLYAVMASFSTNEQSRYQNCNDDDDENYVGLNSGFFFTGLFVKLNPG
jgi:hypothetical protein